MCDHQNLITHCYAGYPGSVHDQKVFRQSEVADYLNGREKFQADSHILGDAAYELHQYLLTPFRDNGHLTERQRNYNYRHSVARSAVERCTGLLKGRTRSLLDRLPMQRVDLMAEYIIACCVIHNICTLRNDDLPIIIIPPSSNDTNYSRVGEHHELPLDLERSSGPGSKERRQGRDVCAPGKEGCGDVGWFLRCFRRSTRRRNRSVDPGRYP